jgi:hypothetical protein
MLIGKVKDFEGKADAVCDTFSLVLRPLNNQPAAADKGGAMKPRLFSSLLFFSLLLVLSGNSFAQSQDVITESDVLALINSVDKATRKGNVAGMVAPLANDIKMKVTVTTPGSDKEQVLTYNKEQWTYDVRRGLRLRRAYTLERKNTRVKLYDDNKTAMVTSNLYETLRIAQGTLRAVSSETAIVTLRNGKLVVTSVETRLRFY